MRLIDADALMKEYAEFVKESNNSDFADVPTWNDAVSLLGSAPTVKAIPIEWLEMQLDVFGDGFYDLRLVIKHWEKENQSLE